MPLDVTTEIAIEPARPGSLASDEAGPSWYALHTRSHCEQLVHDQLAAKGFELFLPKIDVWSRRAGVRHLVRVPLFAGYLFLRHPMDKTSYVEVVKARGLVRILGDGWDRLAPVAEREIDAIERVLGVGLPALPHPYLQEGRRVRITHGPLADVEGILVEVNPKKGLLVLSIELLRRSLAVEMDCTRVVPA